MLTLYFAPGSSSMAPHIALHEDIEAQAQVVSWMSYVASTLHPARAFGVEHARAKFAEADRKLGNATWAVAGQYTIADIHLFRLFWRFHNALAPARDEYPHLFAHHDRIMSRPAVQKTCEIEAAVGYELPEYKRVRS